MKKVLSIFLAVALIVSLASISVFAADKTKVNLISKDLTWTPVAEGGGECTPSYDDNGKLTVVSTGGWPHIEATYADPIEVSLDDEIAFDFKLATGATNINLTLDVDGTAYYLYIHLNLGLEDGSFDSGSKDLTAKGDYKDTIALKDALVSTTGPLVEQVKLPENAESIKITGIKVYAIGGTVEVNSFTVTSDAPAADESAPETSTTDTSKPAEGNPGTGDATMVFVLIALVAMGGAVVATRKVK